MDSKNELAGLVNNFCADVKDLNKAYNKLVTCEEMQHHMALNAIVRAEATRISCEINYLSGMRQEIVDSNPAADQYTSGAFNDDILKNKFKGNLINYLLEIIKRTMTAAIILGPAIIRNDRKFDVGSDKFFRKITEFPSYAIRYGEAFQLIVVNELSRMENAKEFVKVKSEVINAIKKEHLKLALIVKVKKDTDKKDLMDIIVKAIIDTKDEKKDFLYHIKVMIFNKEYNLDGFEHALAKHVMGAIGPCEIKLEKIINPEEEGLKIIAVSNNTMIRKSLETKIENREILSIQ